MPSSSIETRHSEIYDPAYVMRLFDEMSHTYGVVNYVSSFGFAERWRRQCAKETSQRRQPVVVDLMSGMGEMWSSIRAHFHHEATIVAVELSAEMCKRSAANARRYGATLIQANALNLPLADNSTDIVISGFGLKTFSPEQRQKLACEVKRILKPGGEFAFIEISVPESRLLRLPYMLYIKRIIPLVGRLFMGNPDNYRMLGVYTQHFGDTRSFASQLEQCGMEVTQNRYFFGCASGVAGRKPV